MGIVMEGRGEIGYCEGREEKGVGIVRDGSRRKEKL